MDGTVKQLIASARSLEKISDSWRLDAELLLAHVLDKSREYLITWPEQVVALDAQKNFAELLNRRSKGEPVAYLIGRQAFWDFELRVNPSVLIPRPETELLVEKAIELAEELAFYQAKELAEGFSRAPIRLADLGTGSGAIAIALAKQNADWQVTAVDKSSAALAVAKQNAAALKVANIDFSHGSWCETLAAEAFDLIAANPPYVEPGDCHLTEGSLPFEPLMALVAGNQGLADIQQIIQQSKACLRSGGWLLIEHGYDQSGHVAQLFSDAEYTNVGSQTDLAGIHRIAFAQWLR